VAVAVDTAVSAAVHLGDARFEVEQRAIRPEPGEALVRVVAAGICGTDLAITATPPQYEAPPRAVLGHEIYGVALNHEGHDQIPVVVDPNIYCGRCEMCLRHVPTQCLAFEAIGIHHPGGFAELCAVPEDRLLTLEAGISPRDAVLVEPLACVLHGLGQLPALGAGGRAVVLGGGPIGAMFALVLERAAGQDVIVSEPAAARSELIGSRLSRGKVVAPDDLSAAVAERTRGRGAQVVVDAVGSLLDVATDVAGRRATLLAFGLAVQPPRVAFQQSLTIKELTVVSAYTGDGYFPAAVELVERGVVTAEDLVTNVYPLERIEEAFVDARSGHGLKVLIEP
jgi:threonine dehydrogenase-like Zn-dependent dehydrogenase